jgi:hypothetical protein
MTSGLPAGRDPRNRELARCLLLGAMLEISSIKDRK